VLLSCRRLRGFLQCIYDAIKLRLEFGAQLKRDLRRESLGGHGFFDAQNGALNDGFQLVEKTRLSGKPVFVGRYIGLVETPGIAVARDALSGTDAGYVAQQITRMEAAVHNDPGLAIGTAKELVETCWKTILSERGVAEPKNLNLAQLVKRTSRELELTPADIPDQAKAANTIKRLLNNLATITQGIAELRNQYGAGHGKEATTRGLTARHAKLAVGAASTLAVFPAETHHDRLERTTVEDTD
jgi:hypothetical protein